MEDYVSKLEKDLRKKLDHLCLIHNEPAWYVAEHFAELRRQVDYDAEQLLSEVQSVECESGKPTKDPGVNGTRLEFIRILEELEKRTTDLKPQVSLSEFYASLKQKVNAFKDSSDSLDDLEDSYVQLAREIVNETDRLEKRLIGDQTIIYCPSLENDHLGSLVYFGDIYLSRKEIILLMSLIFFKKDSRHLWLSEDFELLVPSNEPSELSKSEQLIESFYGYRNDLRRFAKASKFWYIGKTEADYSGYSAEGSSIEREFVSYQYADYIEEDFDYYDNDFYEYEQELTVEVNYGFDNSANLFDVKSSQSCSLSIKNARMNGLHTNLLPSPIDRLVSLQLSGVHFESFDSHLLATFISLTELKMQVTFSKEVIFDLSFLGALRKLDTLELTLPHSPSDLSAFEELIELRSLKLEGSSFFYAEQRPRLSRRALEQILSVPRLERLELFCFEIEAIDQEMFKECKQLLNLNLARIRFQQTIDGDAFLNIGFPVCFEIPMKNVFVPYSKIKLIYSDIRVLNMSSFAGMTNLMILSLTGNSIADLPRGVFDDLTSLSLLQLDKNLIRHISSGVFDNLKELISLKLDNNPIESVEANAFAELHSLTELLLVRCRLKSINNEMFNGLQSLKSLELNNNMIDRIEVIAKDGRRINVAKANLSDEEKHLFADLISIESLNLSGNKLEKINLNCFSNLKSLAKLDLSSNMINELSGEVGPEQFAELRDLMLNANQLTSIDRRSLPKNLFHLNFSNNRLKRLADDFFAEFTQLSSVDLSENELTLNISEATFASCNQRINSIDLSRNKSIQATEEAFFQMSNLIYINCDFSEHFAYRPFFTTLKIRKLTPEVFQALRKMYIGQPDYVINRLEDICLSGCSIRALTRNPSWNESDLQTLNLDHFNSSWFSRLRRLDFSSNLIETLDEPDLFVEFKSIHKINLSDNRLSRIHRDIFKCLSNLWNIDLSGNNLSSIDMGLFRHQKSIAHLNLSSNNISFINLARLFRVCPRLESLNLADNQLDERSTAEPIDPRSFYFMKTMILANNCFEKMDFVRDMTRLQHLDLRGNRIEAVMSNGENLLGRLSKLTYLDLSKNRIRSLKDEMFDHFYHQLSFVDLSGNPCDFKLDSVLSEII